MEEWTALSVLPNIELSAPIEGKLAALVPGHDPRVQTLTNAHPNFHKFLSRFADAFGEKFCPSVLILQADAPEAFRGVGAVASFRDAIALSVVPISRSREMVRPRGLSITYSNAFWLYPWMLDKDNDDLIGNTPAMLGVNEVAAFSGQSGHG